MNTGRFKWGRAAVLAMGVQRALAGFVVDDFESYGVGTPLSSVGNGWGASTSAAVIASVTGTNGVDLTKAASLPANAVATNAIGAGAVSRVWTEFYLKETQRLDPSTAPKARTNATVMAGVSTNGLLMLYNPALSDWAECSTDAAGSNVTGVAAGAWARVSLFQDYGTHTVAAFLNDRLIRQQVPFISNLNAYTTFRLDAGVGGTAYLDGVFITNSLPPGLTCDLDADGVADARELQDYGALSFWGPVVSNSISLNPPATTLSNNLTVTAGATLTIPYNLNVTGTVQVAAGSAVQVSGGSLACADLTIGAGGSVQVVGGTVTVDGVAMTGSFTLDENWRSTIRAATPNVTDGFESYPAQKRLQELGWFGWGASDTGAVVQTAQKQELARAALIPADAAVSNSVSAATNLWTDFWMSEAAHTDPALVRVDSNRAVMLLFSTNNCLALYNPNLTNWDVCAKDLWSNDAPTVAAGEWARVSIWQDFRRKTFAIFLNDHILRQKIPFISTNIASLSRVHLRAGHGGASYLDAVKIWTNTPTGLTNDLNHDGVADAVMLQDRGDANWFTGMLLKFR